MRELIEFIGVVFGSMLELAIVLFAIFGMILAMEIFEIGARWVSILS